MFLVYRNKVGSSGSDAKFYGTNAIDTQVNYRNYSCKNYYDYNQCAYGIKIVEVDIL